MVLPHKIGLSTSGPMTLAASFGVPVVVSDVPTLAGPLGCPEATFRVGDPNALTETVLRMLSDSGVRAAVKQRLEELKSTSSWSNVVTQMSRVYRRLLDSRRSKASGSTDMRQAKAGVGGDQ